MAFSFTACSASKEETQKTEGSTYADEQTVTEPETSSDPEETSSSSGMAASQGDAVSADLPVVKSYEERILIEGGQLADIKKIDGAIQVLTLGYSEQHITSFAIVKCTPGEKNPEIFNIKLTNLSYDFLQETKKLEGGMPKGYMTNKIKEEGPIKVDYYISASLGYDGNIYTLKSVTGYSLPEKAEKVSIDKSTVFSVFNPDGKVVEEIELQSEEAAGYYDKAILTNSGPVLLGSKDGKYYCSKVGKDGTLTEKETEASSWDYFITDPDGNLCQVTDSGKKIKVFDADLNIVKTEELPDLFTYSKFPGKISYASKDTIVYSADNQICSYTFGETYSEGLYQSRQAERFDRVALADNGDIYASYFSSEKNENVFSVFEEKEIKDIPAGVDPEEPYFIELSEDEKKGIEEFDREKIYSMNPEDPFLPTIVEGPRASLIRTVYGRFGDMKVTSPKDALRSLYQVKSLIGLKEPDKELKFARSVSSTLTGDMTYRFNFVYKGVDVPNVGVMVHADIDGTTIQLQNEFEGYDVFDKIDVKASISAEDAKAVISAKGEKVSGDPELFIYYDYEKHEAALVYEVKASWMTYLVEAHTGDIYMESSNIVT